MAARRKTCDFVTRSCVEGHERVKLGNKESAETPLLSYNRLVYSRLPWSRHIKWAGGRWWVMLGHAPVGTFHHDCGIVRGNIPTGRGQGQDHHNYNVFLTGALFIGSPTSQQPPVAAS